MKEATDVPELEADPSLQAEADAAVAEYGPQLPGEVPAAPELDQVATGAMLTEFIDLTFNHIVAPRAGDQWKMAEQESQMLGDAYGKVLDKYFPNMDLGPEWGAVLATVVVIGPRLVSTPAPPDDDENPDQEPADEPAAHEQYTL